MFLTGPFQQSSSCVLARWSKLLIAAWIFLPSAVLAFQSFEDFSRSRNYIGKVNVMALTDPVLVKPGQSFNLHLSVTLSRGWHIYSLEAQSKDDSLATQIRFEENVFHPEGEWVEPKPIITLDEALDKVVKVHKDSVWFKRSLIVPDELIPGKFTISGNIEFRSCDNKICSLPRKVDFQTQLRVSGEDEGL